MNPDAKLSLMTCYYISKLLLRHDNELKCVVAEGAGLCAGFQADLDQVLESLYLEESEIVTNVRQLESLTRWHQILVAQKKPDAKELVEVERQMFWILGLKRVAE
jgi:hypothetical protein